METTIAPCGGAVANCLGLTMQNPVRDVYLTSGPNRRLRFGSSVVALRHAPSWQLVAPHRKAGDVIRALEWLGPEEVEDGLKAVLPTLSEADRRELADIQATPTVPRVGWRNRSVHVLYMAEMRFQDLSPADLLRWQNKAVAMTSAPLQRLREKTNRYARQIGVMPAGISVRNFKSRWGSCNRKGHLVFNWNIIKAPHAIVNYVVIHELWAPRKIRKDHNRLEVCGQREAAVLL